MSTLLQRSHLCYCQTHNQSCAVIGNLSTPSDLRIHHHSGIILLYTLHFSGTGKRTVVADHSDAFTCAGVHLLQLIIFIPIFTNTYRETLSAGDRLRSSGDEKEWLCRMLCETLPIMPCAWSSDSINYLCRGSVSAPASIEEIRFHITIQTVFRVEQIWLHCHVYVLEKAAILLVGLNMQYKWLWVICIIAVFN